MDSTKNRVADLAVSDESRRAIEASLAAGTSGGGFIALQASLSALAVLLLLGSLALAGYAAAIALGGEPAAWRLAGFALLFSAPIALFLAIQIPFLLALRRGR